MSNDILNSLLKEYEQKKLKAELDLEKRKEILYDLFPRLREIDLELHSFAISTAKNILNDPSTSLETLNQKINTLKKEKLNILIENNYSLEYLQPFYECIKCKDTGYLLSEDYKTTMCNCLKQKLLDNSFHQSNLSNLENENFSHFDENLFSDDVDLSKYKFNFSPRNNILNIKKKCESFVSNFDKPNQKNLLFSGSTGLGKTFMSNCIASELLKKGKTVIYQTAPILLESVINYKMSKQKDLQNNFYESILDCDLLIIDDLGTESLNSMKLSEFFTILNTRILNLNHKVTKTIISTNLNINDIFKFYEERVGSRIVGYYDLYYFFGDDLRFKKS